MVVGAEVGRSMLAIERALEPRRLADFSEHAAPLVVFGLRLCLGATGVCTRDSRCMRRCYLWLGLAGAAILRPSAAASRSACTVE